MRPVYIRVSHDDDPVIPKLRQIEVILPNPATECGDHDLNLVTAQHLVEAGFLHVENLALDRQHGLEAAIPPLFRRPTGRLPFDDVELAPCRVTLLTIGQLTR